MHVRSFAIAAAGLLLAMTPLRAGAIDWEHLVMPGPVVAGHASIEKECRKCHAPFAASGQRELCLSCHVKVAGDIRAKTGFHGRSGPASTAQCRNCHTDHEGRDADIVRLTPQTFDHSLADFPLQGAHQGLSCASCHPSGKKERETPATCVGCHAKDDPHKSALGAFCATCHGVEAWKKTTFDHDRDTPFALTGGHAKAACALCHAGQRYQDTPTTCVACHRIDDVHRGQRGAQCADCHDTGTWKEQVFDHLKASGFALTAGHAGLECQACHAGSDFKKTAGKTCVACHASDDTHQGRNGPECKDCHTTKTWSESRFDHARSTKFPLNGAHSGLACVACHKGEAKVEKLDVACVACHRADDAHQSSLGTDCADCHGEKTWTDGIRFDHDLTRFPLVGLHATAACESCHTDKRYKGAKTACIDCHADDDVHKQSLGVDCKACHTPNDWRIWTFDHDAQTDFRLDGAHSGLQCAACHTRPMQPGRKTPGQCVDCHRGDDVHADQFGRDCARCHDSTSFAGARRRN